MSEETQQDMNYIVPAKLLLGIVVKSEKGNVNDSVTDIITNLENNKEIKQLLFDLSKRMTELSENKGMFVIVPDYMPPEPDDEQSKIITEFIQTMVKQQQQQEPVQTIPM